MSYKRQDIMPGTDDLIDEWAAELMNYGDFSYDAARQHASDMFDFAEAQGFLGGTNKGSGEYYADAMNDMYGYSGTGYSGTEDMGDFDNVNYSGIGAMYKGVSVILERETDKLYCPQSSYCDYKILEKWISLTDFRCYDGSKPSIPFSRVGLCAYKNSLQRFKKTVLKYLCPPLIDEDKKDYKTRSNAYYYTLPPWYKIIKNPKKKGGISLVRVNSNHPTGDHKYRFGLQAIDKETTHAILLKETKALKYSQADFQYEYGRNMDLISEWIPMKDSPPKKKSRYVIVYDIETAIVLGQTRKSEVDGKEHSVKVHIPQALAFRLLDLQTLDTRYESFEVHTSSSCSTGESDIFDKMCDEIVDKYADLIESQEKKIQIFAHNGSRYDNLFAKSMMKCKPIDQIRVGSVLKCLKMKHITSETIFIFKDTMPFCVQSLDDIARTLKCSINKIKFNIVDWTREKYNEFYESKDPSSDWRKYMIFDVDVLAEVFMKLEKMYNELGCSLTTNLGLPGVAFDLAKRQSLAFTRTPYPKDPSMIELIKNSTYGGRVITFKRYFNSKIENDVLICIDANSLYPSAMYMAPFPTGNSIVIDPSEYAHWVKMLQKSNCLDGRCTLAPHYMLTIRFKVPNLARALVPHKLTNFSYDGKVRSSGAMVFPSNGIYEGSYCDVDIREMIIDGYEIVEIVNGMYWKGSSRVFTEIISYLYTRRQKINQDYNTKVAEAKSKGLPTDEIEKDTIEYVLKIILNAMYGKLLQSINSISWFQKEGYKPKEGERTVNHLNGYVEVSKKLMFPKIDKPAHLGVYVLANSRAIMNEFVRKIGIKNIYYGDTDSLYVLKKALDASGLKESLDLGGFKNDYGDKVYVEEAYFLDQKRYFLKKSNGTVAAKYTGIRFKNLESQWRNELGPLYTTEIQQQRLGNMYKEMFDNYEEWEVTGDPNLDIKKVYQLQERWQRSTDSVCIIERDMQFCISPHKKGQWVNHEYFCLGYDPNIPEAFLSNPPEGNCLKEYYNQKRFDPKNYTSHNKDGVKYITSTLPLTTGTDEKPGRALWYKQPKGVRIASNFYLYTGDNGAKSILYCHRTKAYTNSKDELVPSIVSYYNTCILGPTNEVRLTQDKIDKLEVILSVKKNPNRLNNEISDSQLSFMEYEIRNMLGLTFTK